MPPSALQWAAGAAAFVVGTAGISKTAAADVPAAEATAADVPAAETTKTAPAAAQPAPEDGGTFLAPLSFWRRFRFDSAVAPTGFRVQEGLDVEGKEIPSSTGGTSTLSLYEFSQEFEGTWQFKRSGRTQYGVYVSGIALAAVPVSGESALSLPAGFRLGSRVGTAATFRIGPRVRLGARVDVSWLGGQDLSLNNAIAGYDPTQPNDASRLYVMLVRPENQFTPGGAVAIALPVGPLDLQGSVRFDYFVTQRKTFVANAWASRTSGDSALSAAGAVGYRRWGMGLQLGLLASDALDASGRAGMATLAWSALPDHGRIQVSLAGALARSSGGLGEGLAVLRFVYQR